jgi:hypothetical protein
MVVLSNAGGHQATGTQRHHDKEQDNQVNRIIKTAAIAALAAIGVIGTATAASAAVSYDATNDGVITGNVGKGDVQPVLHWNEAAVQSKPVDFTTTFTTTTDTSWLRADGSVAHNYKTLTFKQGLKSEVVRKSNGKIDGWNLTGLGGLTFVKQEITGAPLYDGFAGGLNVQQSHAFGDDLFVNNVLLPETPVDVPVA